MCLNISPSCGKNQNIVKRRQGDIKETQNSILRKHKAQFGGEDKAHLTQSASQTLRDHIFLQNCTGQQDRCQKKLAYDYQTMTDPKLYDRPKGETASYLTSAWLVSVPKYICLYQICPAFLALSNQPRPHLG